MRRLAAVLLLLTAPSAAEELELQPPPEVPEGIPAATAGPLKDRRRILSTARESLLGMARRLEEIGRDIPEDDWDRIQEAKRLKEEVERGVPAYLEALGIFVEDLARSAWRAQAVPLYEAIDRLVPPLPPEGVRHLTRMAEAEVIETQEHRIFRCELLLSGADVLGQVSPHAKVLLIAGKTVVAAEDGALACATRKDEIYQRALKHLKTPAEARPFTDLVRKLKAGLPPPPGADPAMVEAAKAITDPSLGGTSTEIVLSNLFSAEAVKAAFGRFAWEVGSELLSGAIEGSVVARIGLDKRIAANNEAFRLQREMRDLQKRLAAPPEEALKLVQYAKPVEAVLTNALPRIDELAGKAAGEAGERLTGWAEQSLKDWKAARPSP